MDKYFRKIKVFDHIAVLIAFFLVSFTLLTVYCFCFSKILKYLVVSISILLITFSRKNRIYYLLLLAPFSRLLVIWAPALGSLFSWILIYYFVITFIEKMILREYKDFISKPFLVTFILYFFVLLVLLLNLSNYGLRRVASFSVLIFLIPMFCVDNASEKGTFKMILFLTIGFFLSNLLPFILIYLCPDKIAEAFINNYYKDLLVPYQANNGSLRFPGLDEDANINAFYALFIGVLCLIKVLTSKEKKEKITLTILGIAIQLFVPFSQSKSYLVLLALLVIYLIVAILCIKKVKLKYILIGLGVLVAICIPLIFIFNEQVSQLFSKEFWSKFTTERSDLFVTYFKELGNNPKALILGRGINAEGVEGLNDMHNTFLRMIWDLGIIGAGAYVFYYVYFLKFKKGLNTEDKFLRILPIFILIIYSFSLDLSNKMILLVCIFILFTLQKSEEKSQI